MSEYTEDDIKVISRAVTYLASNELKEHPHVKFSDLSDPVKKLISDYVDRLKSKRSHFEWKDCYQFALYVFGIDCPHPEVEPKIVSPYDVSKWTQQYVYGSKCLICGQFLLTV
jgi:hypothetical protein